MSSSVSNAADKVVDKFRNPALLAAGVLVAGGVGYVIYKYAFGKKKVGDGGDGGDGGGSGGGDDGPSSYGGDDAPPPTAPVVPDQINAPAMDGATAVAPSAMSIMQYLLGTGSTATSIDKAAVRSYMVQQGVDTSPGAVDRMYQALRALAKQDHLTPQQIATGVQNALPSSDKWTTSTWAAHNDAMTSPPAAWLAYEQDRSRGDVSIDSDLFKSGAALKHFFEGITQSYAGYDGLAGLSVDAYQKAIDDLTYDTGGIDPNIADYWEYLVKQNPKLGLSGSLPDPPARKQQPPAPAATPGGALQPAVKPPPPSAPLITDGLKPRTFYSIILDYGESSWGAPGRRVVSRNPFGDGKGGLNLLAITEAEARAGAWQDMAVFYALPLNIVGATQLFRLYICNIPADSQGRWSASTGMVACDRNLMEHGIQSKTYVTGDSYREVFTVVGGKLRCTTGAESDGIVGGQNLAASWYTDNFGSTAHRNFIIHAKQDTGNPFTVAGDTFSDEAYAPKVIFTELPADLQALWTQHLGGHFATN